LFDKYLKDPGIEYDSWLCRMVRGNDDLWNLAENPALLMCERAVHAWTFDRALVAQEHFERFSADMEVFCQIYKGQNHLLQWGSFISKCEAEAVGLYGMSVSDNLWFRWDEELGKEIPFDLTKDSGAFEVYDWLDSQQQNGDPVDARTA